MKRKAALFAAAAAVLAILFSGCGQAPASGPAAAYEKLWAVDIGHEGFGRTGASRTVDRQGGDVRLTLTAAPVEYRQTTAPYIPPDLQVMHAGGREYRTGDSFPCWDGVDENGNWIYGTAHTRYLAWERGDVAYSLVADTLKESLSLDIASTQTAVRLEADPLADVAGYGIVSYVTRVAFGNEKCSLTLELYPPHFDESVMQAIRKGSLERIEEDGIGYYRRKTAVSGETNAVSMIWRTDMGLVRLSAGVYRQYLGEVPAAALDFVGLELAKSITEQIGAKIVPLDKSVKQ